MKTQRFHAFGGPAVLKMEDLPRPDLGEERSCLVKVMAAGVNAGRLQDPRGQISRRQGPTTCPMPRRENCRHRRGCGGLVDEWKEGDRFSPCWASNRGGYDAICDVKDRRSGAQAALARFRRRGFGSLAGSPLEGLFRYGRD